MKAVPSVIAFLSAKQESYKQLQTLLQRSNSRQFQVNWLDLRQEWSDEQLAQYDIFLSDAPTAYLVEKQHLFASKFLFWLTDSETIQAELIQQPITDCFLWSEFNGDLLSHCLRRQRHLQPVQQSPSAELEETQGDRPREASPSQNLEHIPLQPLNDYYEKTPAMLHSINPKGEIVAVSDRWLEVMGYERQEVLGCKAIDFLTPQFQAYGIKMIALLQQQGFIEDVDYQFVKKNGEIIDITLSAVVENVGDEKRCLAILTDITDRNRLAKELQTYQAHLQSIIQTRTQALANSEARLRSVFECAPLGIFEMDLAGNLRFANHHFSEMVGKNIDELIGCNLTTVTNSEDLEFTNELLNDFANNDFEGFNHDLRYCRGDRWFWGHLRIAPVQDVYGNTEYLIATVENIHERKLIEESLRTSKARLLAAQKIANIGIWEWDIERDQTYWSAEIFKIYGLPVNSFQPNSKSFFERLHPDDLPSIQTVIQKILNNQEFPEYWEYRIITPTGTTKTIKDFYEIVRDEAGEIIKLRGAVQDITDYTNTIAALEASEARLSRAQTIAHIGIWEWDAIQNQTYWSDETFRMYGLPIGSCQPTIETFLGLVHPDDRPAIVTRIEALLNGEPVTEFSEYRIITPAGETKIIRDFHEAVYDKTGKVIALRGTTLDITESQNTIAALKASEARLSRAQAIANVGIWEWDIENDQTYWSDETFKMFDIPVGSIQPNAEAFLSLLHPDDRLVATARIEKIVDKEDITSFSERRILTPKGQTKVIREFHETVCNEAGDPVMLLGATIDITEFRQAIVALETSEARLAQSQKIAKLGYWENDLVNNQIFWSDTTYELFGVTPDTFEPTFESFIALVHSDDHQCINDAFQNLLQDTENTSAQLEFRVVTPNDDIKVIRAYMESIRDESGQAISVRGTNQDITEDKKTISALEASEARLAKAQKVAKVGVWELDVKTDILTWSDECFYIFDLEPQSIEPNFEFFLSMVEPGDRPRVLEIRETLKSRKTVDRFEYRINTTSSQKIIVENIDVVQDKSGKVTHFSGTSQDITAFRQTSIALQESETRFRELVENIDECFWISPPIPTKLNYVSPAYEKIWGRSCQSVLEDSCSWLEAAHSEDQPHLKTALRNMAKGALFNEEYRVIRPDGQHRWVHSRSAPIHDDHGHLLHHIGVITDISDRKKIELELRSSEARFRSIFDQASLGIAQIALEGNFLLINQAFCNMLGYEQAEIQQFHWFELTHPDDLENCFALMDQMFRGDITNMILEKRYIHKQGHLVWVKVIISFIYDVAGKPESILTLLEDISAYKAATTELAHTQNRYEDLVNGVHAIMYQYSSTRGAIFYSSRLKDILGYDVDYMLENSGLWCDLIHPDDYQKVIDIFTNPDPNQQYLVEYRILDAKGNWRWLSDKSFRIEQINNTEEYVISGLALDITQQKQIDAILRRRRKRETILAEISNRMIIESEVNLTDILALLGEIFQADRMSVMLSQPQRPMVVKRLTAWVAREDLMVDLGQLEEIDLSPYPWWLEHWRDQRSIFINRNSPLPESAEMEREFLASFNVKAVMWLPLQNHNGEHWGYIECSSTAIDHPLWSKEDADLLAIAGNLIYNYLTRKQYTQQLERAKEQAETANYAKSQFLTSMSHELRTPLNTILGFAQVMGESKIFPAQHRQHLDILHASGKKLLILLNEILELARFEDGEESLNLGLFNLFGLLDDLHNMFRATMVQKNLEFQIQRSADLPRYITADQTKLHSVLIHLLSNASKFTTVGHVRLIVEVISQEPLIIRFSVSDTGIGIKELEQPRLFEDFVQLEAGDRHGQGSGLGLALSQKFVKLMGGEINVSSQPNRGSCFSFELRCDAERLEEEPSPDNLAQNLVELKSLTQSDIEALPIEWRKEFYKAACAARTNTLEQLLQTLPPSTEAIAQQLQTLINQLNFETLAKLTQPTELSDEPKQ
ncbi:multi-sensor signal transduction histidine kinase [[Leptolyngbya] sp. PCC 7376]|uniref:PAS domain-containing protein n=1 Tax=[Leptolyngbya] sp. PCC 7376 TaxID=111781 RepID=UPI00029F2A26|nr:PAS domain-containing protein [[Leptolyngbya] sp. PCC 7376]AFY37917.1 multi-sensor signal transduction histidine kinase [[Leptolyngbya] sp. PCC 7376]